MQSTRRIDLVLVDFDDTLVETAPRFERSRRALFERLVRAGFEAELVRRVHHDEVEPVMLREHGFGPFRLEPSFRETYRRVCLHAGLEADAALAEECAGLGRGVAGTPPRIEGALEALADLARALPTVVYTQAGDPDYQRRCLRESGVLDVVGEGRVHITPHKTTHAFRDTLERLGVGDPAGAWMVGNSMRSDVNPALEAGARAILVETDGGWHYDDVAPVSHDFLRAASFVEAARLLLGR